MKTYETPEYAIEQAYKNGYAKGYEDGKRVGYTEEQVAIILQQVDKLESRNQELEKECAWLKSCLNCKIRKGCPRHCGKVVHNCDHWEHGDSTGDAVKHGRWKIEINEPNYKLAVCSVCLNNTEFISNYCPNCGADMRGEEDG